MERSFSSEEPALLQLHKWDSSQLQLNLSEYREAFISPARELLLLLSNRCEALLLPLVRGGSLDGEISETCCDENPQSPCSSSSSSQNLTVSGRSDSKNNIRCASGSEIDFGNPISVDNNILKCNNSPFIFDVKSVAWGACEDTYNQHKDLLFREFLVVSGNRGVTVHAFRCLDDSSETVKSIPNGEFRRGKWVEWGPSMLNQNLNGRPSDIFHEATRKFDEESTTGNMEGQLEMHKEAGEVMCSFDGSKRWMRSFFTTVEEAIDSEGYIWSRFPEKSLLPSSAKVVSFNLFDSDLPLRNLLSRGKPTSNKKSLQETVHDHENNLPVTSDLTSLSENLEADVSSKKACVDSIFKCTRVFSSNSYFLIGFVMELFDVSVGTTNESERSKGRNVLIVAQLFSWGLRWASLVNLGESKNIGLMDDWTDFSFSDNLVICLNVSGLISLYDATSGEFVARLDILQTCGLRPPSNIDEAEISAVKTGKQTELGTDVNDKSFYGSAGYSNRRMFRKLIVASHTSLLAAVDECGVIYVTRASELVPDEYYASEKLLPHFRHLGLGMLDGWEVAGIDIGHQRVFSNLSGYQGTDILSKWNGKVATSDTITSDVVQKIRHNNFHGKAGLPDSWLSGFSAQPKKIDQRDRNYQTESHFMRKIFLPSDKFGEDDCICFSPVGITRFTREHSNKEKCSYKIVRFDLQTTLSVRDDKCLNSCNNTISIQGVEEAFVGESVGCCFQGCFYLVNRSGLSVYLPSISVALNFPPLETIWYLQRGISAVRGCQGRGNLEMKESKQLCLPWQVEILDRVILFEGPEVADCVCLENGWDLKISRIRRLQMALDYLKFDEVNQSLEMLGDVMLAEEGILRLLFTAIYLLSHRNGNDNEVSAVLRLLALATSFATKMIRKYGLTEYRKDAYMLKGRDGTQILSLPSVLPDKDEIENSRRLCEMAHFLEIIRNLQYRLSAKFKKPGRGDNKKALSLVDPNSFQDDSQLAIVPADAASLERISQHDISFLTSVADSDNNQELALMPVNPISPKACWVAEDSSDTSALAPQGLVLEKKVLPLENPKEMMARWKTDNLDLKTMVKDALLSGRLPLAVLQLHLQHSREITENEEHHDTFTEVRDIGRAIAYDLFLNGESGLAIATLQRLGEDVEMCLKQLLFGTVRRSLRAQIVEEMRRYGYLGPYEWKILERISLIERLYPSSHFWETFLARQEEVVKVASPCESLREIKLHLLDSCVFPNLMIECGDVDGVVLGSWKNINENVFDPVSDDVGAHAGYWAAAAVWSNAWDQRTFDRIVMDQPLVMGVHVPWESQLEYYMCHNDWDEVLKLLDLVPQSVLSDGSLQISLDGLDHSSTVGCNHSIADRSDYICSVEEVDTVFIDVPHIKIFRLPGDISCSLWLIMLMEQELAKKLIFLKEYWEAIEDIVYLLARAGIILGRYVVSFEQDSLRTSEDLCLSDQEGGFCADTLDAFHKLFINYCVQYNLPNLLDLYLDHHKLALDNDSLSSLHEAVGNCQWAKWLLLSRIKGLEYDASFSNARSIMSRNLVLSSQTSVSEIDEIVCTVDDIAEGGGEMAALATLMYAPAPIQKCLSSGSVNRHSSSSAQCTLENLRPILQRFPTLWNKLVTICFGQDTAGSYLATKAKNALSEYLHWRDSVFFSAGRDTSLLQMLPYWFPKAVRRLVQLYIQGPLGWLSLSGYPTGEYLLHRDIDVFINAGEHTEISAISWEAIIQKHIEEELYHSSIEGSGLGLEQYLHRKRALAAFDHLLGLRAEKLKLEEQSSSLAHGQKNFQADVQTLLATVTQSEESLLSSVMPLAIIHFEDSALVASCAFLLELCGLSASMLRLDVASLRRISSFYKSNEEGDIFQQTSAKGSAFHVVSHEGDIMGSLARALADEYVHQEIPSNSKQKRSTTSVSGTLPCLPLMLVLHHLEKASLPRMVDGKTCGYWLLTGDGDGAELRSQQKAASQHWNLVALFCQMHQLPLSTKYLALLARDNDWVGFLSEAQHGGYPFDTVAQVASKEFSDKRLKVHIMTVLKGISSRKKASSSYLDTTGKGSTSSFSEDEVYVPAELFRILADCEKLKNPGEFLLTKAKDLSWSILAMIASCFPDVSPLSCLTVWLEITAARETSSIKVNDIASQIARNVAAAVEATNSLPTDSRAVLFHYNRKIPKRRRLVESISVDSSASSNSLSTSAATIFSAHGIDAGEDKKCEDANVSNDLSDRPASLSKMVAVLCEQHLFLPLLRAFELFLPSCSLLPFIRALQAFSQMRLSEASAHLGSFSARIKEEPHFQPNVAKEIHVETSWISSTAVKAADAVLSTCPSPYEKRCLLQLLAATDFADGGSAATYFRRLYWKINLAEPSLRQEDDFQLGSETLDDGSLLTALEKNRQWEQARNWGKQLEAMGARWTSAVHHVTETQVESMVAEWKQFLWDVPEERIALWAHCQTLFIRYSFPAVQAGSFFLKHAEAVEKELPAREVYELLLLSLQWLSGMITQSHPVYPLHLLREIETRVWLLAVESEAQVKSEWEVSSSSFSKDTANGNSLSIIDRTASVISKMDNHISSMVKNRILEKHDAKDPRQAFQRSQVLDMSSSTSSGGSAKTKRRAKAQVASRRSLVDSSDKSTDFEDTSFTLNFKSEFQLQDESTQLEISFSKWEERIGLAELERAVLSLLEFGQITPAKQLLHKLAPGNIPSEFVLVDAALNLAASSTPSNQVLLSVLDEEIRSVIQLHNIPIDQPMVDLLQVLESLSNILIEGSGRGLARKIIAVVKAANILGLTFVEAYEKQPIELLRLLSLKAQESFEEAYLLVQTHSIPAASIAQVLAVSFLKGLLAAHRGGYMDSQDEGPAPLLWRFSDFLKWAELCPSEPEIGHALMRLVITGQEIPHACEVELLILSHHFYKSSACLDGVDVLVALAATRVEAYVSEGDFACLARLITGVGNFHTLNFILGILIENGQLDLLLQKYSAAAVANTGTAHAVRSFRMAVLTSLKHFNPNDLDAFAMVYNHFDMKHETASLLESRAEQAAQQWFLRHDKDQNEDLLDSMRYYIEAAEVHSSIDAGNKTRRACAQASLVSLQIRMPDSKWLNLSETNARRVLVNQSRFQEALIVAEAYGLNQSGEWAPMLWHQMLKPEVTEELVAEFVAVLPLQPSMLTELARFYRAEVVARGDQSQLSVWLTGGGLPADWAKYLERSFRCLLKRTRDLRLRLQLATVATGFGDVIDACMKALDKVPDNAGPLILKKGHGGAYLPLM